MHTSITRALLLWLAAGMTWALGAEWDTGPRPAWVDFQAQATPPIPSADKLEGGAFDLNIETQINLETQETFRRNAFFVVNESGVQGSSSLQIPFDPTYMHLTLHEIKLTRDGKVIDKLDPSKVRMLNREENLESHLLDGNLTFYYPLEDVRVGDAIEYSYTLRGFQPAFAGKFYTNCVLQWSSPVGHQLFRVIGDRSRELNIRTTAGATSPRLTELPGNLTEWRWEESNVPAFFPEDHRPRWHNAFPSARITEMKSWSEVAKWAEGLYELGTPLGEAEKEAVAEIQAKHDAETARIEAALKYVQEKIRYLGFEIGHGSYRPSPGETVLTRRFGDCKDKSQLLTRLLRAMGISASPELVNSAWAAGVADFPPSPLAFNHVICKVVGSDGQAYWLDPTLAPQVGPLSARHAGDYGFGLVVAPETRDLEPIPESTGNDLSETTETYQIGGEHDPVELSVRTVSFGKRAEAERSSFQETSLDRIGRSYRDFYASLYPDIEQIEPVKFTDFPDENRIVVEEKYRIPGIWEKAESGQSTATFYPKIVRNELVRPDSVHRKTPFSLPHPRKTVQNLELKFPEPWAVTFSDDQIETEHFRFVQKGTRDANTIRFRYEFTSLRDHVPPEKIAAHRQTVDAITDKLGWTFTSAAKKGNTWRMNWLALLPIAFGLVVSACLIVWLAIFRKTPPPLPGDPALTGFGGWLILVQIALWLGPLGMLRGMGDFAYVFDASVWGNMTSPGGTMYDPRYFWILNFELFVNTVLLPLQIAAIVFFYQRRWIAPRLMIAIIGSLAMFHLIDRVICAGLPGIDHSSKEMVGAIVRAAIWIPYFLVSKRVRATFVRA